MALLLRGGRVIDPSQGIDDIGDVLIEDEQITHAGEPLGEVRRDGGLEVIECAGRIVAPGFIDVHCHLREPGFEHKETIETGTIAAARGGDHAGERGARIAAGIRVIEAGGVINKYSRDTSLSMITDMLVGHPWLGRMVGYGEIDLLIFDGWDAPWSRIPYDEVPFVEIYALVKRLQPNCLVCELNASEYPGTALYYTDLKAIEFLRALPNTEVRVSYDTHRTRLHAKAYIIRRNSDFGSAYIGSANLSQAALTDGLEWTVKVSQHEQAYLWEKAIATLGSTSSTRSRPAPWASDATSETVPSPRSHHATRVIAPEPSAT